MKIKHGLLVLLVAVAMPLPVLGQPDKLGKVTSPTSCDVQAQFERGVAMLHSYWSPRRRKAFEAVIQQDPGCAIAAKSGGPLVSERLGTD
jgi:hypothetical protein